MDCRFPLDSLACGTQENDSDIPQKWRGIRYPTEMERYLKKLVLDAQAMSFWDS